MYANVLPAGFVLNNATAIDNRGDIVGYGTDSATNTYQAFELLNLQAGDANGDGRVDINDLTMLLTNYGKTAGMGWSTGDFNGDGNVDINDLTIVLTNFGKTSGAGITAVPEPSCMVLLAIGAIGLLVYAWRRWASTFGPTGRAHLGRAASARSELIPWS